MKIVFEHLPIVLGGIRLLRQEGESPFNTILSPTEKVYTIIHELLHTAVDVLDWIYERTAGKLLPVNELHSLVDGKGWEHKLHPMMLYSNEDIYLNIINMQAARIMEDYNRSLAT